jgi:ABC-type phosphonate transport system ATPase subunit
MITRASQTDEEYVRACWLRVSLGQPTTIDFDGEFALTVHDYRRFVQTRSADCWREAAQLTEQRIGELVKLQEELDLIEQQILRNRIEDPGLEIMRQRNNGRWLRIQARLWQLFEQLSKGLRTEAYE